MIHETEDHSAAVSLLFVLGILVALFFFWYFMV